MNEQGRLRAVLVNRYEKITDRLLSTIAAENGDRLLPKVRVADVINVDSWPGSARWTGLAQHFDFVMVDAETAAPKFAVELDGAHHWTDPETRRRDIVKDQLAEWAGLPLLRITSDFTRRRGRWTVLNYAVETFYLSEAFAAAQASGIIRLDEPYMPFMFCIPNGSGGFDVNALDQQARVMLDEACDAGRIPSHAPDMFGTRDPATGAIQSHAWMAVARNRYLVARARVRDFRFQGISASELASQLAIVDMADLAHAWMVGEPVACDGRTLRKHMVEVQQAIDAGGLRRSETSGALEPGGPMPIKITTRFQAIRPNRSG
ncbi:DUF2726 domain-containing protein [Micromonospora chalcea]|uniref:DUF2726 domain-containing protein n=1 Tax=Micromonospora chalcea TaxID=1874 RepID=UPI0016571280|nr:DUF2726 domain-containing protein [Micromonospora chalcea]MBC8990203.1 DUF2726 domain-containing protein [Micromonospora chalcea]MCT2281759.1 DUF2726 domain-containing protein [Micromonospora chalcea]